MNHLVSKVTKVFFPALMGFGLMTSVASAHVEVTPKTSVTGEEETYTVKVPSEKDVPTIKFTIKIPPGLEFDSFEPIAGWNFTVQKGSDGKVKSVTYEAAGQGILPEEFQRFTFVAKNPDKATKVTWDAYQYYKDGSVVEWTGEEGSESPHSITNIIADQPNQDTTQPKKPTPSPSTTAIAAASTESSSLPLTISILAAILSILSFFISIRKNKSNLL